MKVHAASTDKRLGMGSIGFSIQGEAIPMDRAPKFSGRSTIPTFSISFRLTERICPILH